MRIGQWKPTGTLLQPTCPRIGPRGPEQEAAATPYSRKACGPYQKAGTGRGQILDINGNATAGKRRE